MIETTVVYPEVQKVSSKRTSKLPIGSVIAFNHAGVEVVALKGYSVWINLLDPAVMWGVDADFVNYTMVPLGTKIIIEVV